MNAGFWMTPAGRWKKCSGKNVFTNIRVVKLSFYDIATEHPTKEVIMKKMFLAAIAAVLSGICTVVSGADSPAPKKAAEPVWFTSMALAQDAARKDNKVIFVDFTGSDWCPWCVRLHDEVLNQPAFKEYAAKKLVLLLVDFPRRKVQTKEQRAANNALAQKYGIEGFPTILILDANGTVLAKTGYRRGGASAYVEHLKNILK